MSAVRKRKDEQDVAIALSEVKGLMIPVGAQGLKMGDVVRTLDWGYQSRTGSSTMGYTSKGHIGTVRQVDGAHLYLEKVLDPVKGLLVVGETSYFQLRAPDSYDPRKEVLEKIVDKSHLTLVNRLTAELEEKQFLDLCPKYTGFSSGGDPELFVLDGEGKLMPAFDFLPSKKDAGTHAPFWDGFQAEFTFIPQNCLQSMMVGVYNGMNRLLQAARKKDSKAKLSLQNLVEIDVEQLAILPNEHVELGCAPSLNAYPDAEPISVSDPRMLPLRFAGAHMHFGIGQKTVEEMQERVKYMDAILGVAMVGLFEGLEDPRRRSFYGQAGEYRTPPHGIEYRVPPPMILVHPAITHLCYELARQAMGLSQSNVKHLWKFDEREVRDIINGCDVRGARKLIKRNTDCFRALLSGPFRVYTEVMVMTNTNFIPCATIIKNAELLINKGVKELLPIDPEENWGNLGKGSWNNGSTKQSQVQMSLLKL